MAESIFLGGRREEELLERILHQLLEQTDLLRRLVQYDYLPTAIVFKETSLMGNVKLLAPTAGNTLVYTGTLQPSGSQLPSDSAITLASSDTSVSPSVDPTGLIVTIPLPSTFVDNPASPFNVVYSATSASNPGWSLSATITPSIPPPLPTGITFVQTT